MAKTRLGSRLDRLAKDKANKENRTKESVLEEMGRASGISVNTVENILSGNITGDGVPRERLEGFAEVLDVSLESLLDLLDDDATAKDEEKMADIFIPIDVKFQDEGPTDGLRLAEIQIFKRGKFKHFQGEFKLGKKEFESAIENFNAGVPAKDIALNFQHAGDHPDPEISKAAGWMGSGRKGSEMFFNSKGLFVNAFVTEKAAEFIEKEEFLFSSAEFMENFIDEAGDEHGFTVTGLALTNIPFLRNMKKNKLLTGFKPQPGAAYMCSEGNSGTIKVYELIETKETDMELKDFLELSGKDTAEEALKFFKELIADKSDPEPKPEPNPGGGDPPQDSKLSAAVLTLTAEVDGLKKQLASKDDAIKAATQFNQKQALKERKEQLVRFFEGHKIDAGQLETAEAAYVNIEADKVKETEQGFKAQVEFMDSLPERQDLKDLTDDKGATGDDGEPKNPSEAIIFHAQKLIQEEKAKNLSDAQVMVLEARPDLKAAYEKSLNQ